MRKRIQKVCNQIKYIRVLSMNGEEIVTRYSDMIYGVAMRYVGNHADAQDVYSEVFYRYFKKERSFREEEHRKAWLLRVTINCAKDLLAGRDYEMEYNDEIYDMGAVEGSPAAQIEDVIAVRDALAKLGAEYREVLTLYYFQDMTVTQIAEILEESVNTVKSRLLRGREKLKNMLA